MNINGNAILVGIVSFGGRVCATRIPAVYTNIFHYKSWIERNIN